MTESRKDKQKQVPLKNDAPASSTRPSSPGNAPQAITPMDIAPQDASWADRSIRKVSSPDKREHDEALLDEAGEQSFPASDPIAELAGAEGGEQYGAGTDEEEESLDHAIEMTFPASDPIAIPTSEEMSHEKALRNSKTGRPAPPKH